MLRWDWPLWFLLRLQDALRKALMQSGNFQGKKKFIICKNWKLHSNTRGAHWGHRWRERQEVQMISYGNQWRFLNRKSLSAGRWPGSLSSYMASDAFVWDRGLWSRDLSEMAPPQPTLKPGTCLTQKEKKTCQDIHYTVIIRFCRNFLLVWIFK